MKYRYHKQYVREDYLLAQSPIFDLNKFHHLRTTGNVMGKPSVGIDKESQPVLHSESQSLTNVLGFQAGGPNVVMPILNQTQETGLHFVGEGT